jgi:sugar phosphate permease
MIIIDEAGVDECPMPESFEEKLGLTVFLAWLFYLGFVSRILFAPLMPRIENDLGLSHGQAGLMFLMVSMGFLLAPFCSGYISSRINHHGTLKLSAFLVGFALLPCSFASSAPTLGGLLFMVGFAGSIHFPSAVTTITAEIQKSDWGKGLSVHQCNGTSTGFSGGWRRSADLHWLYCGVVEFLKRNIYCGFPDASGAVSGVLR